MIFNYFFVRFKTENGRTKVTGSAVLELDHVIQRQSCPCFPGNFPGRLTLLGSILYFYLFFFCFQQKGGLYFLSTPHEHTHTHTHTHTSLWYKIHILKYSSFTGPRFFIAKHIISTSNRTKTYTHTHSLPFPRPCVAM
jgi:hypothetical protein